MAGAGPDPKARAHAFVADLAAPELDPGERHHLQRVLRLRPGDELTVCDGSGAWRRCRFGAVLEPVGDIVVDPPPETPVAVAFALVKGDRPEWTVQKLTEVGVDCIVPFVAARSVVRWDAERAEHSTERLRRVARSAAAQSRRSRLPAVEPLTTFDHVAGRAGAVMAEATGRSPSPPVELVLVGPEGGWSDDELARGLPRMALGPHVLRAETAAIVAGTLLCSLRAGIVAPARTLAPGTG